MKKGAGRIKQDTRAKKLHGLKKIMHEVFKEEHLFRVFYKFKYPKIFLFLICLIISYFIFKNPFVFDFLHELNHLSYLGVFIAGIFFAFGFTAPFAVGFFIALNPQNIFLAGLVGGLGALISNLLIFKFIRYSFEDEFISLEKTNFFKELDYLIENALNHKIKIYLLYIFAGLLIASPLPDEVGVLMISGLTKIRIEIFALITFILSTIGITFILMI